MEENNEEHNGTNEHRNAEKAVEQFAKRFKSPDLVMSRVPIKELEWFKDKANREFCGDFGMCFKHIIEGYSRLQMYETDVPSLQAIIEKINELELEIKEKDEKPKVRRMLDGSILGERKDKAEEKKNGIRQE